MAYRVKSPNRMRREIESLTRRYDLTRLSAVDNIIHPCYSTSLLPQLAASETTYQVFYETKANLPRRHVQALAESGVRWIQPGIDSLHDETLAAIDKGTTAVSNIRLLRDCVELGVQPTWNMLVGVPGERPEWIASVTDKLPLLFHLPPPQGVGPIRFDRFSPYSDSAAEFGLALRPFGSYSAVYPRDEHGLNGIAYCFEDHGGSSARGRTARWAAEVRRMADVIGQWQTSYLGDHRAALTAVDDGAVLTLEDTRPRATTSEHRLTGITAEIYRLLRRPRSSASVLDAVSGTRGNRLTADELTVQLSRLESHGLVWRSSHVAVALACAPADPAMPSSADVPPGVL